MKKISFIAILSALLLPLHSFAKDGVNDITVMSFNIRYGTAQDGTNSWDLRAPAVLEMIQDQKPDILGLQEAIERQVKFLDYFLDDYKCIGVGRDDGKKKGEFMEILYNKDKFSLSKWGTFWLSETPDKPSKGWDAACYRTATWAILKDKKSGSRFIYVNTHLDHKGQEARRKGLELILSRISEMNKENMPVILTGDFNMVLADDAMQPVIDEMKNARQIATDSDDLDTANGWGKHFSKIDYIWVKGFSSCIEYKTITQKYQGRAFISDHFPIKARLIF